MSAPCRVWLSQAAESLAGASWATVVRAPERIGLAGAAVEVALREPDVSESDSAFIGRLTSAVDALAEQHADQSIALHLGPQALRACIAAALDLAEPERIARTAGERFACIIDWPTTSADRPALIGVDLDWIPPPAVSQRAKFPGGPGSAPSTRG